MKLRAQTDWIVVKELKNTFNENNNIIQPETIKRHYVIAEVISVGNGVALLDGKRSETDIKVGNKVVYGVEKSEFPTGPAQPFEIEGVEYAAIRETWIYAILDD